MIQAHFRPLSSAAAIHPFLFLRFQRSVKVRSRSSSIDQEIGTGNKCPVPLSSEYVL